MYAWAKFPNRWVKPYEGSDGKLVYPLAGLKWSQDRQHRITAIAVPVILMALAVRVNLANLGRELADRVDDRVAVTYNELQDLTGFARATISKALMVLEGMGAIISHKEGRSRVYELVGIDEAGGYCQLPQSHILDRSKTSKKKKKVSEAGETEDADMYGGKMIRFLDLPRKRISLHAMKLYVLLLVYRNRRFNTTAISYDGIEKQAGIRREDIPPALSLLIALELVRVSNDVDSREEDNSQRYKVIGLAPAR